MSAIFDNDIFIASRLAFNDTQSTDLLIGSGIDLETKSVLFSIEGSRRFAESIKINLEVRLFSNTDPIEFSHLIRKDSFTQLTIAKYF